MEKKNQLSLRNLRNVTGASILSAVVLAPAAFAQATGQYDGLTDSVDWTDVGTGLLAVGIAIIGITVIFKGIKMIVRSVKGA